MNGAEWRRLVVPDLTPLERTLAMLSGEYRKPVRVVAFNTAKGWAKDVSDDIAWEVLKRIAVEGERLRRKRGLRFDAEMQAVDTRGGGLPVG